MNHNETIQSLKLVFFSPTGTTKSVIQSIAKGINAEKEEFIDITLPSSRNKKIETKQTELLVVAIPVYKGRVPTLVCDWILSIEAKKTPTVAVVVYGNRAFDNALIELKDLLVQCGAIPFAGGAFIGEHSYSNSELPCAAGRPDTSDLDKAKLFGQKIKAKYTTNTKEINLPGSYPYGGDTNLWHIDFFFRKQFMY
jgi:flavodoxin